MGIARRSVIAGTALVLAIVVSAAGCAATPPAPSDAVASAVIQSLDGLPDDIVHAIRQRQQFGLRSDVEWVTSVAADPRARTQLLDFPMLPEEETEFQSRQTTFDEVAMAVNEYATDHQDEFGGVWIDQERHTVVAAWTANAELHRLAILASLGKPAPIEARLVRYTERELLALQDRLSTERPWLDTIPAVMQSSAVDTMNNRVEFSVSSGNPQAAALILAHFGVPDVELRVYSDGTGILLQPRGTVHITVVNADGTPPGANELNVAWTADRPTGAGDCGEMVGIVVPADGQFSLACPPGGWSIAIQEVRGDDWADVGTGHVVVPSGNAVDLRITLDPASSPSP